MLHVYNPEYMLLKSIAKASLTTLNCILNKQTIYKLIIDIILP